MNIHEEQINDAKVKVLNVPKVDKSKQVGVEYIDELYANIFLVARKKSGKTTTLFNILKNSLNKESHVIFFVSTINKDASYKEILNYLDKKDISYQTFDSMIDGKKDRLKMLMDDLKEEVPENEEEDDKDPYDNPAYKYVSTIDEFKVTVKKRKPQKIAPQYIFVFDDISAEIRNSQSVRALLKMNRHFKARVIISSQYVNDLFPDSRAQIDVWIVFKGHNEEKLKMIYDVSDPVIEFEEFKQLYEYATNEKYQFLLIDKNNNAYRKNFNKLISIK